MGKFMHYSFAEQHPFVRTRCAGRKHGKSHARRDSERSPRAVRGNVGIVELGVSLRGTRELSQKTYSGLVRPERFPEGGGCGTTSADKVPLTRHLAFLGTFSFFLKRPCRSFVRLASVS